MSQTMAMVEACTPFTPDIMRIILRPQDTIAYQAGQYLQITLPDGAYFYSIANAPTPEGTYELHLRHVAGEPSAARLLTHLKPQSWVQLHLPLGACHWGCFDTTQPILFLAQGTGYAPIHALLQQWVKTGAMQAIQLWWRVRTQDDLYMHTTLQQWQAQFPHFQYYPDVSTGPITSLIQSILRDPFMAQPGVKMVLSGPFDMVYTARDMLVRAGVPLTQLMSDAFNFEEK